MKLLFLALVVGGVAVLGAAAPAGAHAVLESSEPADRARLADSPAHVVLTFNEPVRVAEGGIQVINSSGERVDTGAHARDGMVTIDLRDGLEADAYIVTWRLISADTHVVQGAISYTVGDAAAADDALIAQLRSEGGDRLAVDVARAVTQFAAYGGVLLAAGGVIFLVVVHDGVSEERRRFRHLIGAAAAIGAAGVVLDVPVRALEVTRGGLSDIIDLNVLRQALGEGVAVAAAGVLAGLGVSILAEARGRRGLAVAGAAVAAVAFAAAGHERAASPEWLAVGGAAVHAVAAAVWFGGLVLLVSVVRRRRTDAPEAAGVLIARFSRLAGMALLGVTVAGGVLAWAEVRSLDALTSTTYGQLLLVKIGLVAVVAVIGAYNRFRLVPALRSAPRRATALLQRTVLAEAGALVVVIAATAVLVNLTPARTSAATEGPFAVTTAMGDGTVDVVVDPSRAGPNTVHLYLLDAAGRAVDPSEITVAFALPEQSVGPLQRSPFLAAPGHYQLDATDLPIAGTWTLTVTARVDRFTALTATVEVPVRP